MDPAACGVSRGAAAAANDMPKAAKPKPAGFKKPKPEKIERQCLRCDRTFDAQGRFQRLCRPCRVVAEKTLILD